MYLIWSEFKICTSRNIDPIQIIDVPPGNRGFTMLIGSKIGSLSCYKRGGRSQRVDTGTFLISENQKEDLVLNSSTGNLVDTRQADNNNATSSARTHHIDARWHFVRQFQGELVEVVFVRSEDNWSDFFVFRKL